MKKICIGCDTRHILNLDIPRYKSLKYGKHSLKVLIPKACNDLPNKWTALDNIDEFRKAINSWTGPVCGCYLCAQAEQLWGNDSDENNHIQSQ